MITKKEARKRIFEFRQSLDFSKVENLNNKFYDNFLNIDFLQSFVHKNIAGYFAFETECNIFKLLKYYLKNNNILLPAIKEKNAKMVFRKWDCVVNSLIRNDMFLKNKIFEPSSDCKELVPDIVFVPAVAVDIYGNRVGYGAGYYDKTLAKLDCIKIATIFDFQLFNEEIENNDDDIKMDYILTEKNFLKCN